jgi:hypothetical protein
MKVFNKISLIIFITLSIVGINLTIDKININQISAQTNDNIHSNMSNALTTGSENAQDSFNMNGAISSLIFIPVTSTNNNTSWDIPDAKKFVLSGEWSLAANSGKITKLYVNFTKVLADGTRWHSHEFINFKTNDENNKVSLDKGRNLLVSGIVDVKQNNLIPYNNTDIKITVSKGDTIKFILDNEKTGNHFLNQPIYGIVKSINDKEGNKIK